MSAVFNFSSSGKLRAPTEEEWTNADNESAILSLSCGRQVDGTAYYAYIAVKPSKYAEFYRLSKERASINLEDYGVIVAAGPESAPPPDVAKRMVEEYGFDEDFEKALEAELIKQRGKFGAEQEDKRVMDIVGMLKHKAPNGSPPSKAPVKNVNTTNAVPGKKPVARQATVGNKAGTGKARPPKSKPWWTRLFGR